MNPEHFPAPPPEAILGQLGNIIREKVIIEDRTYWIDHPSEGDRLIDHPAVHDAFARDEYMPYWTDLWPASRMLAKAILHEPWTPETVALVDGIAGNLQRLRCVCPALRQR
jgi:hypothetical protein